MSGMICSNCGKIVPDFTDICPACGTQNKKKRCPNCGKEMGEGAFFCTECGTRLDQASMNDRMDGRAVGHNGQGPENRASGHQRPGNWGQEDQMAGAGKKNSARKKNSAGRREPGGKNRSGGKKRSSKPLIIVLIILLVLALAAAGAAVWFFVLRDRFAAKEYYDQDGEVIEYLMTGAAIADGNGTDTLTLDYEFDENSRISKLTMGGSGDIDFGVLTGILLKGFVGGAVGQYETWEYDSDGRLSKVTVYTADGEEDYYYNCEYDSDGNLTSKSYYGTDELDIAVYEYSDGTLVTEQLYSTNWDTYILSYSYNSDGTVYRITESGDGNAYYEYAYEYDNNGNVAVLTVVCYSGDTQSTITVTYEYQAIGDYLRDAA